MASLLAVSRAASEEAKVLYGRRIIAHVVALALALGALLTTVPWNHICTVSALVVEIAAWTIRQRADSMHLDAEAARRLAHLMWAFGSDREPLDAVDLRGSFGENIRARANGLEDPNYYASRVPPGVPRFVESLQESAYWSKHLYRTAGTMFLALFISLGAAALLVFILLEPVGASRFLEGFARALVPVITAFFSLDFLGQALQWFAAHRISDQVDRALEQLKEPRQEELLALFSDYIVATTLAPPIPTFLYARNHDRLEAEWKQRRAK